MALIFLTYILVNWGYYLYLGKATSLTISQKLHIATSLSLSFELLYSINSIFITVTVSAIAYRLLSLMYTSQRQVFKTHASRYFAQAATILSSSLFIFLYSYINILLDGCEISDGGLFEFYTDMQLDA